MTDRAERYVAEQIAVNHPWIDELLATARDRESNKKESDLQTTVGSDKLHTLHLTDSDATTHGSQPSSAGNRSAQQKTNPHEKLKSDQSYPQKNSVPAEPALEHKKEKQDPFYPPVVMPPADNGHPRHVRGKEKQDPFYPPMGMPRVDDGHP